VRVIIYTNSDGKRSVYSTLAPLFRENKELDPIKGKITRALNRKHNDYDVGKINIQRREVQK
jgi:hypothetical protein